VYILILPVAGPPLPGPRGELPEYIFIDPEAIAPEIEYVGVGVYILMFPVYTAPLLV
jgi:hypothetical protein